MFPFKGLWSKSFCPLCPREIDCFNRCYWHNTLYRVVQHIHMRRPVQKSRAEKYQNYSYHTTTSIHKHFVSDFDGFWCSTGTLIKLNVLFYSAKWKKYESDCTLMALQWFTTRESRTRPNVLNPIINFDNCMLKCLIKFRNFQVADILNIKIPFQQDWNVFLSQIEQI